MKRKTEAFDYSFKRDGLFSFLKNIIKFLLVIYIIFFIIFFFLEKGITKVSIIIPLIPVALLFFISLLQIIYHFILSPREITLTRDSFSWKTNNRKHISINPSDILYVKTGLSRSRFNGVYYNDRYSIFLKDGEKYVLDFFMFSNRYIIDKTLTDITQIYNNNIAGYLKKNTGLFFKTYNEEKYIFYMSKYKLKFFTGIISFFLFIFLFIYKIFFFGMLFAFFSVLLLAWPVKIVLNLKNRNIVFKNIFNYKTADVYSAESKKLIINNKFNVSISVISNDPGQKDKNFSLQTYNSRDRKKILEILCLIFENKIEINFDGKELLLESRGIKNEETVS